MSKASSWSSAARHALDYVDVLKKHKRTKRPLSD